MNAKLALSVLAIAVLVAAGAQQSTAEPVEPKAPATAATAGEVVAAKQWRTLRLHNVSPRIVAWWLDPAHNPMPVEFATAQKNLEPAAPGGQFNPYNPSPEASPKLRKGAFELPEGIDQIIPVDPQSALLIYGTEEGVRRLETLVSYLDRPIPQIEIEAQFVETDLADGKAFGIDWSGATNDPFTEKTTGRTPGPGTFSLGYVRGNLQAALKAMVAQGKARIVSLPRVTALNNLTASMYTSTSIPVVLG
ncbi:MAG TPA: hypothetical protein VNA16_02040, partial [Abditibacteriaceae bacterium]|nr:hypothetical protein [Abditibacteriaceae bacterium]